MLFRPSSIVNHCVYGLTKLWPNWLWFDESDVIWSHWMNQAKTAIPLDQRWRQMVRCVNAIFIFVEICSYVVHPAKIKLSMCLYRCFYAMARNINKCLVTKCPFNWIILFMYCTYLVSEQEALEIRLWNKLKRIIDCSLMFWQRLQTRGWQ